MHARPNQDCSTASTARQRLMSLLAVALVGLFYTEFTSFSYVSMNGPAPAAWMTVFFVAVALASVFRLSAVRTALSNPIAWWALAFAAVSTAWALPNLSDPIVAVLVTRVRSTALVMAGLIVLGSPGPLRAARRALVVAVLLGVALNLYDTLRPGSFSVSFGRAAGFYLNPNRSGFALTFGAFLAVDELPRRFRTWFLFLVLAGVLTTFSRGSILLVAIAALLVFAAKKLSWRHSAAVATCALAVAVFQFDTILRWTDTNLRLTHATVGRLSAIDNESTQERRIAAATALAMIEDSPLLGHGLGTSMLWDFNVSSHNMYLNLMVDHGVTGLALMLALLALLARRGGSARGFAVLLAVGSLFTHTTLVNQFSLVCISLAGALPPGGAPEASGGEPLRWPSLAARTLRRSA